MKNVPNIILTLVLTFTTCVVMAQTSVILINGVPTQVQLDGTEIISVKGEVKSHMSGFDTTSASSGGFQYAELRPESTAPVAVQTAPPPPPPPPKKDKVITKSIPTDSPIVSGEYLKFDTDSALLSNSAINEIKKLSSHLKKGKASTVLLESFHRANSKNSIQLIKNRLEACKKYFEVNGVAPNAIITNMYPNDKESSKVSITLR